MKHKRKLRVGDWVEVRSKEEILATLDSNGRLDEMPFMPEMLQYCGRQFQVQTRAHKTCDYTTSYPYRSRRLDSTVHLNTRCDGSAHGGCQAGCLLYWKRSWLKPIDPRRSLSDNAHCKQPERSPVCTEAALRAKTHTINPGENEPTYICQATQIPCATTPLASWDLRQYIEDYTSGNVSLGRILKALIYSRYYALSQAGLRLGRPMRWLYDSTHRLWGGTLFPRTPGRIPEGQPTPSECLNLQPGEVVRVKSHEDILSTVDSSNRNRGMYWDAELVPYCGGTYRVLKRVTKIISEPTGKMLVMKTPCIILDNVTCQARYSPHRMLSPTAEYPYWREIWLERVPAPAGTTLPGEPQ